MKYGNSNAWKKFISSPFTLVVVIVLFLILTKAVWGIREKNTFSLSKLKEAEIELTKLENHQKDLTNQIQYLSTEQGIESELRTKYLAVREGESVAVIVDDNQTANVSSSSLISTYSNNQDKENWFTKFLHIFGL